MDESPIETKIGKYTLVNSHVQIGEGSRVWHFCNLYGTERNPVIIGNYTSIGSYTQIKPEVRIGDYCNLQSGLRFGEKVYVGNYVFIGSEVIFLTDRVPSAFTKADKLDVLSLIKGIHIDDYAMIGGAVKILDGVKVGSHALVGAGSLVSKDVPPFAVVVGSPAKKIGDVREEKYLQRLPPSHRKLIESL